MKLSRRECIGAGTAALLLPGCSRIVDSISSRSAPKTIGAPDNVTRQLNRIAFGPTPDDTERLQSAGYDTFFHEQLNPTTAPHPALALRLRNLDVLEVESAELRDLPEVEILRQLQMAALVRSVYSPNQLLERMVDFWSNHFNIYARKFLTSLRVPVDQRDVIRTHALGRFPDMLLASAKSTAMLLYLDNQLNIRGIPNENYARELMELHTLGVHGGYTQRDVLEVARCLTGWTMENRFLKPRGQFRFDESRHDPNPKEVLGHHINFGGIEDGEKVIEILSTHPNTARFIAQKLCRYFLNADAGPIVDSTAKAYLESGGDIPSMLKVILTAENIAQSPVIVKRPFDFIVSSLRILNANSDGGADLQRHLDTMGQPLHQWPMPDGYPDKTSAWTGSLLARWNFAMALCSGAIKGTSVKVGKERREELVMTLCAPEFQWR